MATVKPCQPQASCLLVSSGRARVYTEKGVPFYGKQKRQTRAGKRLANLKIHAPPMDCLRCAAVPELIIPAAIYTASMTVHRPEPMSLEMTH